MPVERENARDYVKFLTKCFEMCSDKDRNSIARLFVTHTHCPVVLRGICIRVRRACHILDSRRIRFSNFARVTEETKNFMVEPNICARC